TFLATLKMAGSQLLTAKDTTNSGVSSSTQSGITVNPTAASLLQVSGFPQSVIAGTAYNFTVTAFDPYTNIATGYRGTATFSSSETALPCRPSAGPPARQRLMPSSSPVATRSR